MALNVVRTSPDRVPALFEDFAQEKPVLFMGAGLSVAAGLPLAADLKYAVLDNLCARGGIEKAKRDDWAASLSTVMLEAVLDVVARHHPGIESQLAAIFLEWPCACSHLAIAQLLAGGHVEAVVTTNFD